MSDAVHDAHLSDSDTGTESKAAAEDDSGLGLKTDRHFAARKLARSNIVKAAEVSIKKRLKKGRVVEFTVGELVGVLFPSKIRKDRGVAETNVPGIVIEVKKDAYRIR